MLTLVIANKMYSSWSMRPWLLLRAFGIPFEEVLIPFRDPIESAEWRAEVARHVPSHTVPALVDDGVPVWDSLAIIDHVADTHPDLAIWPRDKAARAFARSIAAEMHSGFRALRGACPVNLGKSYAARDRGAAVAADVERITWIWRTARERFGAQGPFLFGAFGAADAMYAPVATRLATYAIAVDPVSQAYIDAIHALPAFQEWREAALDEAWIVPEDEIDEEPIAVHRRA